MKTIKILFTLAVFVMVGLTANAQAKKDTTVIFKIGIHCPSCKAKLDKNIPFEKGIKDYKLNMQDSTVLISFRTDKNTVDALKAAIERHDVKVLGMCDKNGKLIKSSKGHACNTTCEQGKTECDGKCEVTSTTCDEDCGDNCCSKTGKTEDCCKDEKK